MVRHQEAKHSRYKIEIKHQTNVIQTLGVPADRNRLRVIEIARSELRRISTATHAEIRALDGSEHIIYAYDSWLKCQLKALKM